MLAAVLLGLFFSGYFVLGGADIGLGMLLPYLGRDRAERRGAVEAIWPLCLVHEIWLIAAAGIFVCSFPRWPGRLRRAAGRLRAAVAGLAGPRRWPVAVCRGSRAGVRKAGRGRQLGRVWRLGLGAGLPARGHPHTRRHSASARSRRRRSRCCSVPTGWGSPRYG
ncbi:cytochrome d ubiquinol oxidase subunit II [Streptomyces sp. M19]